MMTLRRGFSLAHEQHVWSSIEWDDGRFDEEALALWKEAGARVLPARPR